MQYKLKHSFDFDGKRYVSITLPDAAKVRHELVNIRIARLLADLRKEKHRPEDMVEDELGLPSEAMIQLKEAENASKRMLIEAFCEGFPPDAIDELSLEDHAAIGELIKGLLNAGNIAAEDAAVPEKKSSRPKRSG